MTRLIDRCGLGHCALAPLLTMLAALAAIGSPARAQDWPARNITLVVPFAAGGGTDVIGRVVAEKLSARLGRTVVVENKPGAASAIGTAYVARSAPDGYTLLVTTNSAQVILPLMQSTGSLNYSPSDFAMVGLAATLPNLLIVSPALPVNSVQELIAYGKADPGKLSFASSGHGTITHLIGEMFNARAGLNSVHVPYKTGVEAAPDLMSGRIHYSFDNIIWSLPMIREGKLKGLAITSQQRSRLAPDMPTVAETGMPGFEAITWIGLAVPAKTPDEIVQRLATELQGLLAEPDVIAKLATTGAEPPANPGPEGMRAMFAADVERWKAILSDGKVQAK